LIAFHGHSHLYKNGAALELAKEVINNAYQLIATERIDGCPRQPSPPTEIDEAERILTNLQMSLRKVEFSAPGTNGPADPPLDGNMVAVLACLKKAHPVVVVQYDIQTATKLDRGTVGEALSKLEGAECCRYPHGPRKGAGLTPKGLELAARLSGAAR
jgi:hypothetical protein